MNSPMNGTVYWFYGLSGAGKTTLATGFESWLNAQGVMVLILDGDQLRSGLCKDLGFGRGDRLENVRRAAELAKLLAQQGTTVLAALMSPEVAMRHLAREIIAPLPFYEVYLECDVAVCVKRDSKGLYERALSNALTDLPGIDTCFEPPSCPDLHFDTGTVGYAQCLEEVCSHYTSQPHGKAARSAEPTTFSSSLPTAFSGPR